MDFIGKWYIENTSLCDEIVEWFNKSEFAIYHKKDGRVKGGVYRNIKSSTDLSVDPSIYSYYPIKDYLLELQKVAQKYIKKYKWCNEFAPWSITEGFNIQHYKANEGYPTWHTERGSSENPEVVRHLVFMTYLNDVTDQGETEWYHQKVKIQPRKGLTVIWPSDWTHLHRGIISPTQEKYIVTGWYSFHN